MNSSAHTLGMTSLVSTSQQQQLEQVTTTLSRDTRQADLDGAYSGYGPQEIYCPEGIPIEQALFGVLAAFGASFGFLFRAVTIKTGGRRKRADAEPTPLWWEDLQDKAADMYWWGRCMYAWGSNSGPACHTLQMNAHNFVLEAM